LAAGFSFKKRNVDLLRNFIEKDFLKKNINFDNSIKYDSELSVSAINSQFLREIYKLGPFGNENSLPIFLIKNVKIIKSETIKINIYLL
jgi:single-stranded-DNA-specific exonuclease